MDIKDNNLYYYKQLQIIDEMVRYKKRSGSPENKEILIRNLSFRELF
jgi:hypothetical protein